MGAGLPFCRAVSCPSGGGAAGDDAILLPFRGAEMAGHTGVDLTRQGLRENGILSPIEALDAPAAHDRNINMVVGACASPTSERVGLQVRPSLAAPDTRSYARLGS